MKEVGYSNTTIKSHDETSLVIYEWCVPNPKAFIHLVHGMVNMQLGMIILQSGLMTKGTTFIHLILEVMEKQLET